MTRPVPIAITLARTLGIASALLLALGASAQDLQVPRQHQKLYDALEQRVTSFRAALPRVKGDPPLLRGAPLRALSCATPGELLSPSRRAEAQREMDALRRIGAQVLVLDVCYPLLTPSFHDPRPILELLANVANDARMRQLRLLVRHGSLPAEQAVAQGKRHYRGLTKARFFEERAAEAKLLILAVQPDYLTLVGDPRSQAGLTLQPKDWRVFLDRTSTQLREDLADLVPPLGAGSSVAESPLFIDAFAGVSGISYIDLRFYRTVHAKVSLLDRLIAWPRAVRARDSTKRIVLSDVWLSKASDEEPAQGPYEGAAAARASYGFWSPLDVSFLRAIALAARTGGIEMLSASRSDLLFSYVDYFDPTLFRASPRQVVDFAAQRAAAAREQGSLSDTGRAFGAL